jgi:hypothetical protein
MRTFLASTLFILAIIATDVPIAGPQPGAQIEGKQIVAQRACPRGC